MKYIKSEVYEFVAKQTTDPIVEWKTCRVSGKKFAVYQSDIAFYDSISPTFNGKKFQVPTPTLCPEERARRRMAFRNERTLHRRKCDATNKDIISIYSQDTWVVVYNQASRWSDSWTPFEYGFTFDWSRTFWEQFSSLRDSVPRMSLINDYQLQENSHYINLAWPSKDCYLIFETNSCEKSMYSYKIFKSDYCVDSSHVNDCQYCYECVEVKNCMMARYCYHCSECSYSDYCVNCRNLDHCFGCANLNSGKYMIFNKQYTKEEYADYVERLMKEYSCNEIRAMVEKHAFHKEVSWNNNEWFVSWNHIQDSKNVQFSYDIINGENCKYCDLAFDLNDCYDYSAWWENSSRLYEVQNSGIDSTSMFFTNYSWEWNSNIWFSEFCIGNNKNLFGCNGLRNAEYCIFNKQYTPEEYEKEVARIITHMQETWERWEFFDPQLSVFWYNETLAMERFPLSKQEALEKWFKWLDSDATSSVPEDVPTISSWSFTRAEWNELRDDDSITNKIMICEETNKPFRILKQELEIYRKMWVELPKKHPDVRHAARSAKRPWRELQVRSCDKTWTDILTVYPEWGDKKVYANDVYEQEMYG